MINKVVLMGRLVKDPELRHTGSGTAVTNFTVAVDDGFGENRTTSFINCVAWSKSAEFVGNYFSKGKMIIVIGRIQTRTWDGQDGKKNYVTEVVASEVSFGETKKNSEENAPTSPLPYNDGARCTTEEFSEVMNIDDDDLPF